MKTLAMTTCLLLTLCAASAFACGFEGSVTRGNSNSKVHHSGEIITSWDHSKSTFPENGWYSLELGSSACGESVELYIAGCSHGRHRLPKSGNIRYDIHYEGQNNTAVGCRR